jgi:hypothetical protein
MKIPVVIPFNRNSQWATHRSRNWEGFYFFETVLDWSLFKGCKGKLCVETMHNAEEGGELALSYQQTPPRSDMKPIEGSIIKTYPSPHGGRWLLTDSEWFDLPIQEGVSCLWIIGRAEPNKNISVALATLVIKNE